MMFRDIIASMCLVLAMTASAAAVVLSLLKLFPN